MDNVEAKVKELVTDFKLEEALEMLIAQAQTQTQRKQNVLLVLKGKLALLEEQSLSGMLGAEDVARHKATIAHQILDIADGSPLDFDVPVPKEPTSPPFVQKTVTLPSAGGGGTWVKYLLLVGLVVVAVLVGVFISKSSNKSNAGKTDEPTPEQPKNGQTDEVPDNQTTKTGGQVKVLDFPRLQQPFIFLDFGYEFRWAEAEWISDSEISLKIRCYITCKSNLGICYRADMRIYADNKPIAPAEQSNLADWMEHDATITDDLAFVLPADAKEFHVELSRDHSTWKRGFKILTR